MDLNTTTQLNNVSSFPDVAPFNVTVATDDVTTQTVATAKDPLWYTVMDRSALVMLILGIAANVMTTFVLRRHEGKVFSPLIRLLLQVCGLLYSMFCCYC